MIKLPAIYCLLIYLIRIELGIAATIAPGGRPGPVTTAPQVPQTDTVAPQVPQTGTVAQPVPETGTAAQPGTAPPPVPQRSTATLAVPNTGPVTAVLPAPQTDTVAPQVPQTGISGTAAQPVPQTGITGTAAPPVPQTGITGTAAQPVPQTGIAGTAAQPSTAPPPVPQTGTAMLPVPNTGTISLPVKETFTETQPLIAGTGPVTTMVLTNTGTVPGGMTTTTTVPSSTIAASPLNMNFTVSRNFGILAGGTKVRIHITYEGNSPITTLKSVNFGGTRITLSNITEDPVSHIVIAEVLSPPHNSTGFVSIFIEDQYGRPSLVSDFEYRDNPTISDIFPTKHLTSGGTKVTLIGSDLDAAESSKLQLRVIVKRPKSTDQHFSAVADCFTVNLTNSNIVCRMPPLILPDEFLNQLRNATINQTASASPRVKRATSDTQVVELTQYNNSKGGVAEVFLDYQADSYIENVTGNSKWTFAVARPYVNRTGKIIKIRTNTPDSLRIMGGGFNQPEVQDNLVVSIGSGNCTITSLTDNVIQCQPPVTKPSRGTIFPDNLYCNDGNLAIILSVNQAPINETTYLCDCSKYYSQFSVLDIALITSGLGIFVFIIILAICVAWCWRRNQKKRQTHSVSGVERRARLPRARVTSDVINPKKVISIGRHPSERASYRRGEISDSFNFELDDVREGDNYGQNNYAANGARGENYNRNIDYLNYMANSEINENELDYNRGIADLDNSVRNKNLKHKKKKDHVYGNDAELLVA